MPEQYSEKQVKEILFEAMNGSEQKVFSRTQLEEMAVELGISPTALDQAITSATAKQPFPPTQAYTSNPFSQLSVPNRLASVPPVNQVGFNIHLKVYCAVNIFLLLLNFTLAGTITWAVFPLLGWGLGVSLHSISGISKRSRR